MSSPALPKNDPTRYVLYYRQGNELGYKIKWFDFIGDLPAAIVRGRNHCTNMNFKFLFVRPFLSDLDQDEKQLGT